MPENVDYKLSAENMINGTDDFIVGWYERRGVESVLLQQCKTKLIQLQL